MALNSKLLFSSSNFMWSWISSLLLTFPAIYFQFENTQVLLFMSLLTLGPTLSHCMCLFCHWTQTIENKSKWKSELAIISLINLCGLILRLMFIVRCNCMLHLEKRWRKRKVLFLQLNHIMYAWLICWKLCQGTCD